MAKRAQLIYEILQEQISRMDSSKKGGERVSEFLRVIEFENASEATRGSLLVIEEQKLKLIKTNDIFHILKRAGVFNSDWKEYYLQLQRDFRQWVHCDEVRKVAGKPTGTNDLFRLYILLSQQQ